LGATPRLAHGVLVTPHAVAFFTKRIALSPIAEEPFWSAGIPFRSLYQYIAHAHCFYIRGGDRERRHLQRGILSADRPGRMHGLLNQSEFGFHHGSWEAARKGVLERGMLDQLHCNARVRETLLRTGWKRRLVFASEEDWFHGSGIAVDDLRVLQPQTFPGRNQLGHSWESARRYLLSRVPVPQRLRLGLDEMEPVVEPENEPEPAFHCRVLELETREELEFDDLGLVVPVDWAETRSLLVLRMPDPRHPVAANE
jgi:predicted NAD-dependent protein-ADP-ribosyltransferase YbiA (DUF1768 family)